MNLNQLHFISRPRLGAAFLLLSAFVFAGCAGRVTKEDCQQANFYEMGLEDGKDGKSAERLQKYQEVCGSEGIAALSNRYHYGRQVGLVEYCDADKARSDAKDGAVDPLCMEAGVPPYQHAYTQEILQNRDELMEELAEVREEKAKLEQRENELQGQVDQINTQGASSLPR